MSQEGIIEYLKVHKKGITKDMAKALGINQSSCVRALKILVENNEIHRKRRKDNVRVYWLHK